jgi:hypothetical protein
MNIKENKIISKVLINSLCCIKMAEQELKTFEAKAVRYGGIYGCQKCTYKGTRPNATKHYIRYHLGDDEVPYLCKACKTGRLASKVDATKHARQRHPEMGFQQIFKGCFRDYVLLEKHATKLSTKEGAMFLMRKRPFSEDSTVEEAVDPDFTPPPTPVTTKKAISTEREKTTPISPPSLPKPTTPTPSPTSSPKKSLTPTRSSTKTYAGLLESAQSGELSKIELLAAISQLPDLPVESYQTAAASNNMPIQNESSDKKAATDSDSDDGEDGGTAGTTGLSDIELSDTETESEALSVHPQEEFMDIETEDANSSKIPSLLDLELPAAPPNQLIAAQLSMVTTELAATNTNLTLMVSNLSGLVANHQKEGAKHLHQNLALEMQELSKALKAHIPLQESINAQTKALNHKLEAHTKAVETQTRAMMGMMRMVNETMITQTRAFNRAFRPTPVATPTSSGSRAEEREEPPQPRRRSRANRGFQRQRFQPRYHPCQDNYKK